MIEHDSRYFSLSGDIPIGGPSTWHIVDWDRRRVVSVTMDGDQDDADLAIEHFSRYNNELPSSVYRIYVSDTGEIISQHSDPKDDQSYCMFYPLLSEISIPEGVQTVRRDELEEMERLGPDADLVSYPPCSGVSGTKAVFKYCFLWQYSQMSWKEMNLWMRLPSHPNIVPFDKIVVDELESRIVGFTSAYMLGGSLEKNRSRTFKLEWLRQLIQVVDLLNLQCGISHQDIAPRNLLVDELTDTIKIFYFNFAARISHSSSPSEGESYIEDRNDVKGVVFTTYELITQDYSLRDLPHEDQNLDYLAKEWVKHPDVKLDHPIASYRLTLEEWQKRRADMESPDAPELLEWPSRPRPPPRTMSFKGPDGQLHSVTMDDWDERRQDVQARGDKVLNWERPPQRALNNGTRVLSTGQILECPS
ncbi:hypothetical protein F5Y16DRAFT_184845 [Xylariaceae sp. FL0255]|nr:hypothetical protein F5Y16DRAFT_184845 [Xylariaceae sp. FL0255]